jgi:thiamine-phosphate pyrophosphorylase
MSAPPFLMLSDLTRQPDWRAAVTAQPRSVGLVLRDYDHHARAEMAAEMARLCHGQGRYFSIAGDARLAAKHGAAFHCPSHMLARLPLWRGPRRISTHVKSRTHTAAVHNHGELIAAKRAGFTTVLISPIFATPSHADAAPLLRAAREMGLRAYALGGMDMQSWHRLGGLAVADGFAAIRSFAPKRVLAAP